MAIGKGGGGDTKTRNKKIEKKNKEGYLHSTKIRPRDLQNGDDQRGPLVKWDKDKGEWGSWKVQLNCRNPVTVRADQVGGVIGKPKTERPTRHFSTLGSRKATNGNRGGRGSQRHAAGIYREHLQKMTKKGKNHPAMV